MTNTQQTTVPDFLISSIPYITTTEDRDKFYKLVLEIFGTDQEIEMWLYSSNAFLSDERPIDLLATNEGTTRVKIYLLKIESGTYV
jgi:hypothetical protein